MSREKLKQAIDEAEWSWLRDHAARDAVIIVAPEVDLVDAGEAISTDDSAKVSGWIQQKQLSKPTREQLNLWETEPTRRFMSLVVSPYVLIQERLVH